MAILVLHVLLICQILSAATVDPGQGCIHSIWTSSGSMTYDLRALMSPSSYVFGAKIGSYHSSVAASASSSAYEYLINVCSNVHPDRKHAACSKLPAAPVYQITAPSRPEQERDFKPECYQLADSGTGAISLLDPDRPEAGIKLVYSGGQTCLKRNTPQQIRAQNATWRSEPRQVELQLQCDPDMPTQGSLADLVNSGASTQVWEKPPPNDCQYVLTWRTPHACPKRASPFSCPLGLCAEGEGVPVWLLGLKYLTRGAAGCGILIGVIVVAAIVMQDLITKQETAPRDEVSPSEMPFGMDSSALRCYDRAKLAAGTCTTRRYWANAG